MALRWAGIGSPVKIGQLKPASSSSSAHPADHIPIEADRGFRIVTAHSGLGRKSVTFAQNPRSASFRITGHVRSESAVRFVRNTHLRSLTPVAFHVLAYMTAIRGSCPSLIWLCQTFIIVVPSSALLIHGTFRSG